MFIVTARLPKRRRLLPLLLLLPALLLALLCFRHMTSPPSDQGEELRGGTNEERLAYLRSLGWEASPEPLESVRLTLPEELTEPYRSYNALQVRQGFDLTPWLGETVERYTYAVTNHPARPASCQADLYVCRGEIIAGDVICTGANGFIDTLEYPEASGEQ